ncbi:MAG: response regulator [Tannerella sp.]|jgi:signal transduction histidine kinase/ligand-binding sensor domain-containing protein/AraC-like DNA-binding protein|nr:response regulator [Tannerella sp.]
MKNISVAILFLIVIPVCSNAGKNRLWTPNEGLSNSHILQITQDSKGYIWIATENGLNKFNGYQFTVYSELSDDSTSFHGNYVYSILEDRRGWFWVGSAGGLFRYDVEKDRFYPFLIQDSIPFYLDRVTWLLEDKKGNIWVSYPNNGIICIDAETLKPRFYNKTNSGIKDDNIDCIYEDRSGNLWMGTYQNGVYLFDTENETVKHFKSNPSVSGTLNENSVFSICEDAQGRVLIGTLGGGVNIFDSASETFSQLKTGHSIVGNQIYSMICDKNGNVWLGTDGAGIIRYETAWKKLPPEPLPEFCDLAKGKIHCFFEDRQGNMWIALYQKGILFISSTTDNFENYGFNPFNPQYNIGTNCVISVLEDTDGAIWVGTDGDGLYKINTSGRRMEYFTVEKTPGFPSNVITALFEDQDKNIWIGTYVNGMFRYNRKTKSFDSYYTCSEGDAGLSHNHVISFVQGRDGTLWVGTNGGGLNRLDTKTKQIKSYKSYYMNSDGMQAPNPWIYTLHMDEEGIIWMGTSVGVTRFNPDTESFETFQNDRLNTNLIFTIARDHKKNLWFGSILGLYRLDKETGEITRKTISDGLPDNMINGVEEDGEHFLWLSTGNGLCKYNPETGDCLNFYAEDGIKSNEFRRSSHYKGKDGRLYFGGINGLTTCTPNHFTYDSTLLYLAFTDFLVYNEPVQAGKSAILEKLLDESESIRLKYNQRNFTFRFAAVEYGVPQRVLYYTQMENFDKHWRLVNNPNRSVTYTNLNPGKYIFKVKATLDGVHFLEREIKVMIEPPFLLSIWAKFIYAALILLAGYCVFLYLDYRMKQKQTLLEKERQKQLSESKLQFFTDVSHEIRTPLTLILSPIEKLKTTTKDEKTLAVYKIIHQNALRILRLVNQLMDLRAADKGKLKLKLEKTSLKEFVEKIMNSFRELSVAKQINFNLVAEENFPAVYIDRDCIDKVIFNMLSNAFKFTGKGGRITTFLDVKEGKLEISVEDTGIGIAKENQTRIFDRFYQVENHEAQAYMGTGIGLHLSKMMVELHRGKIFVESEPGKGAKFFVRLPLDKSIYKPEEFGNTPGDVIAMTAQPFFPLLQGELDSKTCKGDRINALPTQSLLLVEDDPDIIHYIESELSPRYKVYKAGNGKDGLNKALKYIPDIVISDIVMPEMDGLVLCKALKSNDKTCHIPVILLTAKTHIEQIIEGIEMGADSYIPKPFNLKHLETRIEKLIELRKKLKGKYGREEINNENAEIKVLTSDEKLFGKFNDLLRQRISDSDVSVETISQELGLSRVHLNRRLKAIINDTPGHYIHIFRLKQAALLLTNKKMTIAEVAYAVGFASHSYFSNQFREHFGLSPLEYIKANKSDSPHPDLSD